MTLSKGKTNLQYLFSIPVIVAALGYFVDIYDLLLFGIVRVPSLIDLGLSEEEISSVGASILNWQMTGLLLGGILWGGYWEIKKEGFLSFLARYLPIHWQILLAALSKTQICKRLFGLLLA